MDAKTKKKLVVPAVLAVAVIAAGCTSNPQPSTDAGQNDAAIADAGGGDAGCVDPYQQQPDGTCQLVV